jgi:hypothetical protein
MPIDANPDYLKALADPSTPARAAELLRGGTTVLVRGFLSEAVVMLGERLRAPAGPEARQVIETLGAKVPWFGQITGLFDRFLPGQYFDTQIAWLREENLDHVAVDIESEDPIGENARIIGDQLDRIAGDVTLVTHSKGCLDALEALRQRSPESWKRVKRWIAIQGPFGGTPVADVVAGQRCLRRIAEGVLTELGKGSVESLTGMQTSTRAAYHGEHKAKIEQLLAAVPTLCMGSSVDPKRLVTTFLGATVLLIEAHRGGPNDGLVPVESALLPGAMHVRLPDVDHAMPVMDSFAKFPRLASLQALLLTRG